MKNFIKNNWKYLLFFIIILLFYWIVSILRFLPGDSLNNYGFSHAIRIGEVPYRDFNTVSTPLYAFVMSLGLFIYDNHLTFIIEQSILFTIMFYFFYNTFEKKSHLIIASFFLMGLCAISTTYNFFCLFLLSILLYLEKKHNDKDLLIGFLIGSLIMTKHTVGIFFVFPSVIFYIKNKKKILKRLLGLLIPCTYFLIYLIVNKALYSFIDLCFLGLFDFGSKNHALHPMWGIISILSLLILLFIILKDKKNILNYYLICGFFFIIPIFEMHHYSFFFICLVAALAQYIGHNIILRRIYCIICFAYTTAMLLALFFIFDPVLTKQFNHFNYLYMKKDTVSEIIKTEEYLKKWNDPIFISYYTMMLEIKNDKKIDYYAVPLNGNFGYNGNKKMIDRLEKEHNRYIIISTKSYEDGKKGEQFCVELVDYVMKNFKFIEENKYYKVYYKE